MARKKRRLSRKAGDKGQGAVASRWKAIGFFAGELFVDALLYLVLLLFTGMISVLVELLPRFTSDREFLHFAGLAHLFLLAIDGILFVWVVLYLIVRGIKEYLR